MRDDCGLQHNSCDGTLWFDRLWSYYPAASSIGENVAYGYASPLDTLNQFLCDEVAGVCAADNTEESGHRNNIMNGQWREAGMGFASPYWWTQDFAYAAGAPASAPTLVAGSHVMTGAALRYFVNYYAPGDVVQSVDLILDGTPIAMDLDLGSMEAGTWSVTAPAASGCQSYYFEGTGSLDQTWRYPEEGQLRTYGIGSCTEDYQEP
jgi:hypothetical protein